MAKKNKIKEIAFPYLKEITGTEDDQAFIKKLKNMFLREKFIGNTEWSKVNDDDDGKPEDGATVNHIYKQTTAPASGMVSGDIWFDTDDSNKPYRYSGSAWEEVTSKTLDRNDFHWFSVFESLDGFGKTETNGGTATVDGSYVQLSTGTTQYAAAGLGKALGIMNTFTWDVDRRFRTRVVLTDITEIGSEWGMGGSDKFLGFAWRDNVAILGVTAKMYAVSRNGGSNTETEISVNMQAGTADDYEVVYTAGVDAKFYVNGVLKATITTNLPTGAITDHNQMIQTYIQNFETVNKIMRFSYWDFWQSFYDPFA